MSDPFRFIVITVAAVVSLLACQRPSESPENTQTAASSAPWSQSLPDGFESGLYSGVLPCASCPGIETRVDFRDDNTYLRRRVYLNGPATEDRTFFDLGRWTTLPGGRLVLRANGGDVTRFSVASAGEIGLLDERGMAIDSDANLNLRAETGALEGFGPTTVRGMYTYFADAAILAPCNTRVRFPVAMIERHVDVEESYLENRSGPGAPLLVEIVARLEQVPAMEGDGTEEAVIVTDFQGAYPGASCFDEAALTDSTGWVLRELNGLLIERDDPEMIPSLTFGGDRITGSTGCNRLTGPFESSGREFRLGPLAMTRQACADTLESTFVAFLEDVESHQVFGDELELSSASGWVALLKKRGG